MLEEQEQKKNQLLGSEGVNKVVVDAAKAEINDKVTALLTQEVDIDVPSDAQNTTDTNVAEDLQPQDAPSEESSNQTYEQLITEINSD